MEEKRTVCVTGASGYIGSWLVKRLLERGYHVRATVRDPGMEEKRTVCVTGASGYIGSWLVKRLLERGYHVRATVRDPGESSAGDEKKVKTLLELPKASTHLSLWKADLAEENSYDEAIQGCEGVFHVATPMELVHQGQDGEEEIESTTLNGILSIMRSCSKPKTVKRFVYTSTTGTITVQPQPPLHEYTEDLWTDVDLCYELKMYGWMYLVAKTTAEKAAWKYAEENGINMVTVHPSIVLGHFITPHTSFSTDVATAFYTRESCAGNEKKVKTLLELPKASTHLSLWKADLAEENSYDEAIQGCKGVFHVATPMELVHQGQDGEEEMESTTLNGILSIMRSCSKANTVKRFVYTSSTGTITVQAQPPLHEYTEDLWTDVDLCYELKMYGWMYLVAKTTAEKAAWKYAEENGINMVTIHPSIVLGHFITPHTSFSTDVATAFYTKNEANMALLKKLNGSNAVHLDDVCNAHIFLFEHPLAKGRYICSSHTVNLFEIAHSLSLKYPDRNILTEYVLEFS
uniref:Dihydroflavonol 4-reductase n=1 Tax=Daucus carota subsp. sativus TaxID=79200 RepID=A0A164YC42_DAUCS